MSSSTVIIVCDECKQKASPGSKMLNGQQCQRAAWPFHKAHYCAELGLLGAVSRLSTSGEDGAHLSKKATKKAYASFCKEHEELVVEGDRLAWEHRDKMPIVLLRDSTPPTVELLLSLEELASTCTPAYNILRTVMRTRQAHDHERGYHLVFFPAPGVAGDQASNIINVDREAIASEVKAELLRLMHEANERGEYQPCDEDSKQRLGQAMQNVTAVRRRAATAAGSSISRVVANQMVITSLYSLPKDQMDIRVIESLILDATGTDATPEQIRATLQRAAAFYANHAPHPSMFHNFNAFCKGVTEGWMKFKVVLDNLTSAPHLNGEEGTVLRKVTDSSGACRYVVRLENGREIAVRRKSFSTLSPFIDMR